MDRRRIISLVFGGVATLVTLVVALAMLVYRGYYHDHERIFIVSVALGPVAMVSVMVGYGVWWAVMFLMSLLGPTTAPKEKP
jgi:hypothetical protein